MKVVDRKTFLTLPPGTIYCKGVQWAFDGLSIKGDTMGDDWAYLNPAWPYAKDSGAAFGALERSLSDGSSFPSETSFGRDGCFDNEAVFLIFEREDLVKLRYCCEVAILSSGQRDQG